MSWERMETCPRDGSHVLLHHPAWNIQRVQGWWDAEEKAWRLLKWGCVATQPELWHPLPSLPEQ